MNCFAKFLANRIASIGHAINGLGFAFKTQGNTRVHLLATIVVIILGIAVEITRFEWMAIAAAIALVWMAELFNTAFEYLCDIVHPDVSEKVKRAKDTAAAAVLVAAIAAAIIGGFVFLPYLTA